MVSSTNLPNATMQLPRLKRSPHDQWRVYLFEGIGLVVLGVLAIVVPPMSEIGVTIFVGWMLLIGGVSGLISTEGTIRRAGRCSE